MKGNCTKLERFNGTTWDLIAERVNITGPGRSRETVEEEEVLDCGSSGGASTKKKSPGTKEIGDITCELIWNPSTPDSGNSITNTENHHLFESDFDNETATHWRVRHADTDETGVVVHATVKEVGEPSYQPNQTVKRTITLEPTGEHYELANDVTNVTLPAAITAPSNNWGS